MQLETSMILQGTVWMCPLSPIEATATAPGPAKAHQAPRSRVPQDSSVCKAETHRIVSHLRWHTSHSEFAAAAGQEEDCEIRFHRPGRVVLQPTQRHGLLYPTKMQKIMRRACYCLSGN